MVLYTDLGESQGEVMENHSNAPGVAPVPIGTPTQTPSGKTFIGGKSREFQAAARQVQEADIEETAKKKEEEKVDESAKPCPVCNEPIDPKYVFCGFCGLELGRKSLVGALGIELTDDDVSEYLFKGYLAKEITLTHGKKGMFKTLLPKESYDIENKVTERFKGGDATHNQYNNYHALMNLSYGWVSFDGVSFGDTPAKRQDRLESSVGVHLLDIASKKWSLFNRAVSAMLEDPEVIKK